MIFLLLVLLAPTLGIGFFCGWIRGRIKREELDEREKQKIYCAGWEDSIYNILDEYDKRYYSHKRAMEGFKEFQSLYKKDELN